MLLNACLPGWCGVKLAAVFMACVAVPMLSLLLDY